MMRAVVVCAGLAVCSTPANADDKLIVKPGGSATTFVDSGRVFSSPWHMIPPDSVASFAIGKGVFEANLRALQPVDAPFVPYNASSCSSCHRPKVVGSKLANKGGLGIFLREGANVAPFHLHPTPSVTRSIEMATTSECGRNTVSSSVSHSGSDYILLRSIPLFGAGLLDIISDIEILQLPGNERTEIEGRLVKLKEAGPNQIGRFGWFATSANLSVQIRSALHNEMGLGADQLREKYHELLPPLEAYVKYLGVPAQYLSADAQIGRSIFTTIGCESCHRRAYSVKIGQRAESINVYSDFRLHDVGTLPGENREIKTPPLWGVKAYMESEFFVGFLHDGSAPTLDAAIKCHRGAADDIRRAYEALPDEGQAALLSFLSSL